MILPKGYHLFKSIRYRKKKKKTLIKKFPVRPPGSRTAMADADYVEWAANETTDVLRYRLRFTNRSNWSRGHQYTGSTLSGIVNSKCSALQFEL